jgi:hypothetical protein
MGIQAPCQLVQGTVKVLETMRDRFVDEGSTTALRKSTGYNVGKKKKLPTI